MPPAVRRKRRNWIRFAIPLIGLAMIALGYCVPMLWPGPRYREVDLKSLGAFPLDQTAVSINDIPTNIRALDGKKVSLLGFMWLGEQAGPGVTKFQFVYEIPHGDFHPPPVVQERIFATAAQPVPYFSDAVELHGTLHVNVKHDPAYGNVTSVFEMDVDSVIDPTAPAPAANQDLATYLATEIGRIIPIGFILLAISGFWEALLLIRRFPSRRYVNRNICPVCGYDLRASRERCPECGTLRGWSRNDPVAS